MLLPQARVRKFWLQRALVDYPLYDPPHKVEERRLSKDKARENFDYFMRVRQQRLAFFRDWLRRYFRAAVTLDESGMRALNSWGNKYAGLLLVKGPSGHPNESYFTYDPPWTGENAGHNVLFDTGIALGEAIIASCPKLNWDPDPISGILPRTAKMLRRTSGNSFQRPTLAGFDNPACRRLPLHDVYIFAVQIMRYRTTFEGTNRFYSRPIGMRRNVSEGLLSDFKTTLRDYPAGDPYKLRERLGHRDFLELIDSEAEDVEVNNE
jgi:hypothetical protein